MLRVSYQLGPDVRQEGKGRGGAESCQTSKTESQPNLAHTALIFLFVTSLLDFGISIV